MCRQGLSKNQKVSALIIYPEIDQKFYDLKKEKDLISKKVPKNDLKSKEINDKYRIAKTEFNKKRHNLINAAIYVVRIYGGVNLGIPGLINAYSSSSEDSIKYILKSCNYEIICLEKRG